MKVIGLKAGENSLSWPTYCDFRGGKVVAAEVFAKTAGTVTISRSVDGFTATDTLATITVASDFGMTTVTDKYVGCGDKIMVSGTPVTSGTAFVVRLYVQD